MKTFSTRKLPLHLNYKRDSPVRLQATTTQFDYELKESADEDLFDEYKNLTPPPSNKSYTSRSRSHTPLNLNGGLKRACKARTRVGTPCKISSLPGRDFCYRHQSGDSVMM